MIAPLILIGAGVSLAIPAAQLVILASVELMDAGEASGTFTMTRYLGDIFGVAIVVTTFSRSSVLVQRGHRRRHVARIGVAVESAFGFGVRRK